MKKLYFLMSFLLVALIGSAAEVTDVITNESFGVTGSGYTPFSGKKVTSDALYAGKIGASNSAINFRGGTNYEGFITTTSGGTITKIVLTWASGYSTANRPVIVYAKNEAYTGQADLYDTTKQGTEIYNKAIDTQNKTVTIIPDGEYTYVGFACGNSKYIAFDKIEITWSDGAAATDVKAPTFSLKEDTYYEAQQVTIATETEGASITYSITKNGFEYVATTTALAPVTVDLPMDAEAANYVITAKAIKEGLTESAEVTANYTLNPNKPAERLFYMADTDNDLGAGDEVAFISPSKLAVMTEAANGTRIGSESVVLQDGISHEGQTFKYIMDLNQNPKAGVYIVGVIEGNYTFQSKSSGAYLSAVNDNKLNLVEVADVAELTDAEKWTIKVSGEGIVAYSVAFPDRVIQRNNSSAYFAAYKGTQSHAHIFKYVADWSGVESNVAEEAAVINTVAGGVVVAVSEPATASVYTVSGQLVASQVVDATATINLANGFYIVKVGNTVKKVIVR